MAKRKVLFLCTSNSARSQMAEAYLRKYGGDDFEPYSAGLEANEVHPMTRRVLEEAGIDTSQQRAKSVREFLGHEKFEFVVVVCRRIDDNCPTVYPEAKSYQRWVLDDPVKAQGSDEQKLAAFRAVREKVEARVKLWIEETLE
jgi:arsenate reductase (thioredoxin)